MNGHTLVVNPTLVGTRCRIAAYAGTEFYLTIQAVWVSGVGVLMCAVSGSKNNTTQRFDDLVLEEKK